MKKYTVQDEVANNQTIEGLCGDNCVSVSSEGLVECPNYARTKDLEMFSNFSLATCLEFKLAGGERCVR